MKKIHKEILSIIKCNEGICFEEIQFVLGHKYDDEQLKDSLSVLLDKCKIELDLSTHLYVLK